LPSRQQKRIYYYYYAAVFAAPRAHPSCRARNENMLRNFLVSMVRIWITKQITS
jgi:hypothetical protein